MLGSAVQVHAAAALKVGQVDGKPLVTVTAARLAAWRPAPSGLVVVIPAESGEVELGTLPEGVKADIVPEQNGLKGVVVAGVATSWQVVQDGANWIIRPGTGLKPESVLMLRDGWRVRAEVVRPKDFQVLGKTWQVGLVDEARSVAGSVAGVVKIAGAGAPVVAAAPVVAPVKETAPKLVAVEAAAPLRAVGVPSMAASALPVVLPRSTARNSSLTLVSMDTMLARIEPAAGVSGDMGGARAVKGGSERPLPVVAQPVGQVVSRAEVVAATGLEKVVITPAKPLAAMRIEGVTSDVLPQVLGDIYLPGTLVSLTLPLPAGVEAPSTPHASIEASLTAAAAVDVSKSWNQSTLEPLKQAIEEAKAAEAAKEAAAKAAREAPTAPEPVAEVAAEAVEHPADVAVAGGDVKRLFPARTGSYVDEVSDALLAVAEAPEDSTRARDGKLNLAGIYLAWQRPEEALAVLAGLPVRTSDKQPANPQARLYMALAQLAAGKAVPPRALLDQGGTLAAHAKLWRAVAASRAGDYSTALETWPEERGILPQYPAYLREVAQEAQATALVMVGDRKVATEVIDQLVGGYERAEDVPVALTRLRGLVRLGTKEESQGLEYLAAAAQDMRDPITAYRAKYEFVKALQQRRDLSDEQVRTYLTDLWFDWRGDDLEREVLNALADLYDKANEPREALQYWQTLVRAYPKAPELGTITERMTEAFLKVFDPENPKIYDTLAYAGLYYDFRELVPNDARGDRVHEQMARLLMDANLWDRAAPILEQQLQYRPLEPLAQARLSLMLAEAYGNMGRAADGLKTLDKWEHTISTDVLRHAWKVQEATMLLKLNRPDAARKALAGMPADDAELRDLRIEANWMAQDWSSTVPLLQAKLASVPASELASSTDAQLATFRLGYAYGQLKDADDLNKLTQRYAGELDKLPQLADGMGAVAAGTGLSATLVQGGPLAPLTGALSGLNQLTDRIQGVRDTLAAQKKDIQEYNDKMRYMELLPPPAI